MDVVSDVLLVAGGLWFLLASLGVLRLTDVFARVHAATKATTLGLGLVVAGAALRSTPAEAGKMVLAFALVLVTAPVGAHLLGRAVHRTPGEARVRIDTTDELAGDQGGRD